MYGAELQIRSAPHAEIKSEADDRAFSEPNKTSKNDVIEFVCALDSGGLIRVIRLKNREAEVPKTDFSGDARTPAAHTGPATFTCGPIPSLGLHRIGSKEFDHWPLFSD